MDYSNYIFVCSYPESYIKSIYDEISPMEEVRNEGRAICDAVVEPDFRLCFVSGGVGADGEDFVDDFRNKEKDIIDKNNPFINKNYISNF